jgi:hypothetical protein
MSGWSGARNTLHPVTAPNIDAALSDATPAMPLHLKRFERTSDARLKGRAHYRSR